MTLTVLTAQEDLRISGYASLFGRADMSGDIVHKGAFSAHLLLRGAIKIPMLFGHETQDPIGIWDRVFEDRSGLFVSGRILSGPARANHTLRLVQEGALSGLSIGYRVCRHTRRSSAGISGRNLLELELFEVSVVAFPMLPSARITQIEVTPPIFNPTQLQQGV